MNVDQSLVFSHVHLKMHLRLIGTKLEPRLKSHLDGECCWNEELQTQLLEVDVVDAPRILRRLIYVDVAIFAIKMKTLIRLQLLLTQCNFTRM